MVFTILSLWVFRIPVAYYLLEVSGMGATGVWYAIAFSNTVTAILAFLWFRRGTWKTSEVGEANAPSPAD